MKKGFSLEDLHRDTKRVFEKLHELRFKGRKTGGALPGPILGNEDFLRLREASIHGVQSGSGPAISLNLRLCEGFHYAPPEETTEMVAI
jgi:hypothetical protein